MRQSTRIVSILILLSFGNMHASVSAQTKEKKQGTLTDRQTYDRHLVLDSRKIATKSNVSLVLGKIKKHSANPLFGDEKPWKQLLDNFY